MSDNPESYWTTRTGSTILIKGMSDSHLVNTIRFLRKRAKAMLSSEINACMSCSSMLQGEMATYYVEQDLETLLLRDPLEHLLIQEPRYKVMLDLAKQRNLGVNELYDEAAPYIKDGAHPTVMELLGFSSSGE